MLLISVSLSRSTIISVISSQHLPLAYFPFCPVLCCLVSVPSSMLSSHLFCLFGSLAKTRCWQFHVNPIAFSDIHNTLLSRSQTPSKTIKSNLQLLRLDKSITRGPEDGATTKYYFAMPGPKLMQCE